MEKTEALKICKLYDGNDRAPGDFKNNPLSFFFWEAEEDFILSLNSVNEKSNVEFYRSCVLDDSDKSLPIALKASLFVVFCHGSDDSPRERGKTFVVVIKNTKLYNIMILINLLFLKINISYADFGDYGKDYTIRDNHGFSFLTYLFLISLPIIFIFLLLRNLKRKKMRIRKNQDQTYMRYLYP